ncbi:MAG: putative alpha/beta hydrolase family esterase, partial [Candidatus Paceibacteria bacterium]
MKKKQQILHIHGGMPAINYQNYIDMITSWDYDPYKTSNRWSRRYDEFLGENFEIIRPEMPNGGYAHYKAWDVWFQKVLPYIKDEVTLVGHSLGGGFLMKWMSQNKFPMKIKQLHLVAPTFDHSAPDYDLGDFNNTEFPGMFTRQDIREVHIYHSKDDAEV